MGLMGKEHSNSESKNVVSVDLDEGVGFEKETNATAAIEDAVKVLLLGLEEDINREGIRKTPFRVAKAFYEGTRGYRQKVEEIVEGALFPEAGLEDHKIGNAGGEGGLVIVRDTDLYSYCESCLLPFQIKCHIGYIPSNQRVVGLSKLPRVAEAFAKRLQEPQRLADEICSSLYKGIQPEGVAVILQCTHIPFPCLEYFDSNHKGWVKLLVSSGSGVFENKDAVIWGDFFNLLISRGIEKDKIHITGSLNQCWCPCLCSEVSSKIGAVKLNPIMVTAVSSILKSLGEDSTRKELIGTPSRFVKWMMNFQCVSNIDMKLNGSLCLNTNGEDHEKKLYSEVSLPFWSQCEHHLLPFYGAVHIGYFLSEGFNHIGKSILQSIVHFYGFKLQVQERLTKQIAETISPLLGGNVIVVVEASHTCMISRGIEKFGSNTATFAVLGRFATDLAARAMFMESIPTATSFEEQ